MNKNKLITFLVLAVILVVIGIGVSIMLPVLNRNQNTNNYDSNKQINQNDDGNTIICWNRVIENMEDGTLYWRDGCKGSPNSEMCSQALVELTENEKQQYYEWKNSSKNIPSQCLNEITNDMNETNETKSEENKFTRSFVMQKTNSDNCYVMYGNSVYLIPKDFQKRHPGGSKEIQENCGKDITNIFANVHKKGNLALNELMKYRIGELSE
ncbi:MAG: cytochrome b5 domain-containing protein [Candidatus Dojkabacteria bacterium]|nr:cytochrome b5 domain-containing protein [Candidatus Dojkabacteria bacterium]